MILLRWCRSGDLDGKPRASGDDPNSVDAEQAKYQ